MTQASTAAKGLRIALRNSSTPAPVFAETWTILGLPPNSRVNRSRNIGRSDLLRAITGLLSLARFKKWRSSQSKSAAPSTTTTNRSASAIARCVRSTPMLSIRSVDSRIPAVSVNITGNPLRFMCSLRVSRVVPAISVTMARSVPSKRLNRLDLPLLGRPTRVTLTPSRRRCPWLKVDAKTRISEASLSRLSPISCVSVCGKSSSTNSTADSSGTIKATNLSFNGCRREESSPFICRTACCAAASV